LLVIAVLVVVLPIEIAVVEILLLIVELLTETDVADTTEFTVLLPTTEGATLLVFDHVLSVELYVYT